jgi:Protein of unknown function (DUF3563)
VVRLHFQRKPIVSKFFGLIQAMLPEIEPQQARDQAYLAQSVDIYDLERRMREIDQRGRCAANDLTFSLGLR